ncbi:ChbG/HpnK family deacetylase [Xylocopilactobacillus apis]|uniref:PTS cellbiose transporter subunit IIC n=1 Tax=Xylocopilactobacillus apis TaxID=2932183 RepID=A0AAU9D265_9LACO|nr:ChbG/HpnK family deacetylase [Xylocopilactobacillus apis]BDR55465.1 PTS cellbiose transporter subunit IIC [Xylocopilactobacillus apis]
MTKKIIVNADDFGMSEAFNYGVIKAFREGIVSSTSIMINQEAASHGISLLKEAPDLYVGLHVNLTTGNPVSDPKEIPSLVKPDGSFIGSKDFKTHKKLFSYKDALKETKAQINRFREMFGFYPTHIEPHSAMDDNSAQALIDCAKEYKIHTAVPLKGEYVQPSPELYEQVESPVNEDYMSILDRGVQPEDFFNDRFGILKNENNGLITELHFHPGFVDQYILDHSTLTLPRVRDNETLCSEELKGWIIDHDIELISFGDLKKK